MTRAKRLGFGAAALIAGGPDNVQASMSHYVVLDSVMGYRSVGGNQFHFNVRTVDGRRIAFDPATGGVSVSARGE